MTSTITLSKLISIIFKKIINKQTESLFEVFINNFIDDYESSIRSKHLLVKTPNFQFISLYLQFL